MKQLLLFIILTVSILLPVSSHTQNAYVRKVDLYIIPFRTSFRYAVAPNKVKRISRFKLSIKSAYGKIENIDFLDYINDLNDSSEAKIGEDYRVVCIVRKLIGREVLYFNQWGDFLYKGKTYKDERIKSFVFKHLPEYCK